MNKLWLLRRADGAEDIDGSPWSDVYDQNFGAFGFVVRAETLEQARSLAHAQSDDLGDDEQEPWLSERWTTCVQLPIDGPAEVIISDFSQE